MRDVMATIKKDKNRLFENERVISLRVSGNTVQLLEELSKKWELNLSEVMRRILSIYFLPIIYEKEWEELKDKRAEYLVHSGELKKKTLELERLEFFHDEAMEYLEYLVEIQEQNINSFNHLRKELAKMSSIAEKKNKEYIEALSMAKYPPTEEGEKQ